MASRRSRPLIAVDVGNSRVKLGVFEPPPDIPLPRPARTAALGPSWTDEEMIRVLAADAAGFDWAIASVNRPSAARLLDWLKEAGATQVRELTLADLPLAVEVERPDQVGLDRLANVLAVNRIRNPQQPVIIIDMGSCLTFNLVSAAGAFVGGAILPGVGMSARALDEFTDALPRVEIDGPVPALGKNTAASIRAGVYWGAVGAARTLVAELTRDTGPAQIFLTGGAGPIFADALSDTSPSPPQLVPHLTLSGIALASLTVDARKGPA